MINDIELKRRQAHAQHRINLTSSKQEVERNRRKVNMENLKSAGARGRPATASGAAPPRTVPTRPKTAPKRNFVNKAVQKKKERQFQRKARVLRLKDNAASNLFSAGGGGGHPEGDQADPASSFPSSTEAQSNSRPPDLRPNWDHDHSAMDDPTKNPKKWLPGRPQLRSDPGADHRPEQQKIPSPLGRRGHLVGRAPGRFGPHAQVPGRLELLLSTLPEVSQTQKKAKKRNIAASWSLARKKMKNLTTESSIAGLETSFDKIKRESGIQTMEEFTENFLDSESRQFALVKQIKDLERALSVMMQTNRALTADKEELEAKNNMDAIKDKGLFGKITKEIAAVKAQEETEKKRLRECKVHIRACIQSVKTLLDTVDSKDARAVAGVNNEQALYIEELMDAHGVSELVLPQFLGSIEERVLQLMQVNAIIAERT